MSSIKFFQLTLAYLLLASCSQFNSTVEPPIVSQASLNMFVDAHPMFSGSVIVAQNGEITSSAHIGYANLESGVANDAETAYSVASIGKMFTAVAIAQLVEAEKLTYETPVLALIPELDAQMTDEITVDHLLHHTSGFGRVSGIDDDSLDATQNNHALYTLIMSTGVQSDGPSKFAYRNTNFQILGEIIERLSDQPYEDYIRDNIVTPTGMTGPIFTRQDRATGQPVALPYLSVDFETWWNSEDPIVAESVDQFVHTAPPATPSAGGGAYATAADMILFARALRNSTLISAESFAAMCSLSPDAAANNRGYGRGCSIDIREQGARVGHTGSSAGVHARFFLYLQQDVDVVVLSNHEGQASPLFNDIDDLLRADKILVEK